MVYNNGNKISMVNMVSNGGYINADINAEASEKVIECKSRYSFKIMDIKNDECNSNINGKFTTYYEDIKWCNNEEVISLPVDKLKQYMIFVHYKDNLISGINIKEDDGKANATYYYVVREKRI